MTRRISFLPLALLVTALALFSACDEPENVVHAHFKKDRINQLKRVQTGIHPGMVFFSGLIDDETGDEYASQYQNMFSDSLSQEYQVFAPDIDRINDIFDSKIQEFSSVIGSYEQDRYIKPKIALDLVERLLGMSLGLNFEFRSSVKIDLITANSKAIEPRIIEDYLESHDSIKFRLRLADHERYNRKMRIH